MFGHSCSLLHIYSSSLLLSLCRRLWHLVNHLHISLFTKAGLLKDQGPRLELLNSIGA